MKKTIPFIILLLYSLIFYGRDDVKKYYKYIDRAEISITKGDLEKARKLYNKAFRLEKVYFGRDIRTALKVEEKLIPDSSCIYWSFNNYVKMGFQGYKDKSPNSLCSNFNNLSYWKSIEKMLDTVKLEFNVQLSVELQQIVSSDQKIRDYCKVFCEPKFMYCKECLDTINVVDSINLIRIINLYSKYSINSRTVKSEQLFNTIGLILNHNNSKYRVNDLFKITKKEVLKGNYDARDYITYYDQFYSSVINKKGNNEEGFYGTTSTMTTNRFFIIFLPTTKKQKKEINQRRKEIYLGDYLLDAEKYKFQFEQPKSLSEKYFLVWKYNMDEESEKTLFNYLRKKNIKYNIYYSKKDVDIK